MGKVNTISCRLCISRIKSIFLVEKRVVEYFNEKLWKQCIDVSISVRRMKSSPHLTHLKTKHRKVTHEYFFSRVKRHLWSSFKALMIEYHTVQDFDVRNDAKGREGFVKFVHKTRNSISKFCFFSHLESLNWRHCLIKIQENRET